MKLFTVVNRTSKDLEGLWDGKHYTIPPGKSAFPEIQALKFKEQNPLMGSLNPYTNQMTYLIGIEDQKDDCTPLEQSDAVELWSRQLLGGPATQIVPGKGGLFATERHTPLPTEGAFVKP